MKKLQGLKSKIKEWNKLEFGNLEGSRYELEKKVEIWAIVEEERSLDQDEIKERNEAKRKLWEINRMEDIS